MRNLFRPVCPKSFIARATKDFISRTIPANRCGAFARTAEKRCGGETQPLARRCASLIRAKKFLSFPSPANEFGERQTMKTKSIATIAAIALLPIAAFTQTPPNPPNPPTPPGPPGQPPGGPGGDRERHEKKVPVTYLGVETSDVPNVVSEQLGLAKGFGLVVDYVVPDGPAAAAGVQQNDILKMLNDQILTEPDQLSKLVRSFSEGTTVTLTVLRKGKEEKIGVKLSKKEVRERHEFGPGRHRRFNFNGMDFGDFGINQMKGVKAH